MTRKKVLYFQQKKRTPPRAAQRDQEQLLREMDPLQLAQGINRLIGILEDKGVTITDYDHKERRLYGVKQVKGNFYFLAAPPDGTESGR